MDHKEMMELGAIAIGALALLVVLRRGGSPDATPPSANDTTSTGLSAAPNYLTQNQPTNYVGSSVPLNVTQGGGSSATPCACGQAPVDFASLQSFSDALTATDENIVNSYQQSIMAAMPDWMGQFINNTFAPDETAAAQGNFSQLAAYA